LIYFVLLTAFYIFFEIFRFRSGADLLTWSSSKLYHKALPVYQEYMKKHESLEERLAKEGMVEYQVVDKDGDDGGEGEEEDDDGAVKNVLHTKKAVQSSYTDTAVSSTNAGEKTEVETGKMKQPQRRLDSEDHSHHSLKKGLSWLLSFLSNLSINNHELNNTTAVMDYEYRKVFTVFIALGFVSIFVVMLAGIQP
jgi:hypothetical protein